ncbi:hypothetical protein WMF18_22890 [Sorangium sp. So ce315]|uniref:hypothetical protein n=1 Tax=Sorangium sp. So ce315 TaxID=3133299 RepID=UPI003F627633
MISDPLVDEVRAIRDAIAKEHDYDIDAIFEELRRLEASGRPTVPPPVRGSSGLYDSTSSNDAAELGVVTGDGTLQAERRALGNDAVTPRTSMASKCCCFGAH